MASWMDWCRAKIVPLLDDLWPESEVNPFDKVAYAPLFPSRGLCEPLLAKKTSGVIFLPRHGKGPFLAAKLSVVAINP